MGPRHCISAHHPLEDGQASQSHGSTLLLCHILAPALQKAAETFVAKVLAHAPLLPRSSFSAFFRTCLTPTTGWAAPVSSSLPGQQDLTREQPGSPLTCWKSRQRALRPGQKAELLADRAALLAAFVWVQSVLWFSEPVFLC